MRVERDLVRRKQLRKRAGPFHRTFEVPCARARELADGLLDDHSIRGGALLVDQVVYSAERLERLLARNSLSCVVESGLLVVAEAREELAELIEAALWDGLDCWLVPEPRSFVVWMNHEDETTVFGHRKRCLTKAADRMSARFVERREGSRRE